MNNPENSRLPLPPFDYESAIQKVRIAEDAWNTRNPERVSLAYTSDSVWRNRSEFLSGREAIVQFLTRKWLKELDYRLIKELWAFRAHIPPLKCHTQIIFAFNESETFAVQKFQAFIEEIISPGTNSQQVMTVDFCFPQN